jgi:NAD(P)H-nitrite reductase large subunit
MRYLIIGYSTAAVSALKAIRSIDKENEIVVLTDEDRLYSRPLISYYLAGKVSEDKMNFVEDDFDKKYNLNVYYSTKVVGLDIKNKIVVTDKKQEFKYDKLLITSGGVPIVPPIKGLENNIQGIFTFTKLLDAKKLLDYITKNRIENAVILGGGLIGMKSAEGLLARSIKFYIIDIADRLLANTFDNIASEYLEKKLEEHNCKFIKSNTIVEVIAENGILTSVKLKDGSEIKTNLLIIAVGVRPNIDFIKDSGIKINKGILVDEHMRTNIEDIFAAGDVTESKNSILEENSVIAIWPTAAQQGKVAGLNMAGDNKIYEGLYPMNSVEILGIPSISFGITNIKENGSNYKVLIRKEENLYKKIVLKDNKIVGVILLGNIERAGIFKLLIDKKVDVKNFEDELLKDDFGFLVLPKDFRKHLVVGEGVEI